MSAFRLSKVSDTIVDSLSKSESFSEKEFCHIDRLMVNEWCDRKIVSELIAAKNEIGKNFKIYNRYRDIIIPRHTEYNGFTSKYHTFIKLMQAFELGEVETNFRSFYDLCFAPGAFSEGLFRCFDIERGYGITLIPSRSKGSRTALRIDEDIVSNPKFKIISPKCGNLYLDRHIPRPVRPRQRLQDLLIHLLQFLHQEHIAVVRLQNIQAVFPNGIEFLQ